MTPVPQVYLDHLAAVTGSGAVSLADVWEADGVLEFPYADSLGTAKRLEGLPAIAEYFSTLGFFGPFTVSDLRAWKVEGGAEYVLEMHGSSTVVETGASYEQDYVVRFGLAPGGRIAWMREFWDPTRLTPA